jgi:hypothetical protein
MKGLERKSIPASGPTPPGSLAEALAGVPDPRRPYGWRPAYPPLPLVGLLQLAVAAILCGAKSLNAIAQWGRERVEDEPAFLVGLGLPPGRSPCVATLHRVFKALDVEAFEGAVGTWLARTGVAPTDALALDGKTLRGVHGDGVPGVHLVGAYAHGAQTMLAQLRSAGKGHELAAAKALLGELPVAGRVVTGDALLTQRAISRRVVAGGGDYLLPADENQPRLRAGIARAFSPMAADGPDGAGASGDGAVPRAGPGRVRRAARGRDAGGAEGAARATRGADALGAARSGLERRPGLAARGAGLPGGATAGQPPRRARGQG